MIIDCLSGRLKLCMYRFAGVLSGLFIIHTISVAQLELQSVAEGYTRPVSLAYANDHRLFVVQQGGEIMIVDTAGNKNDKPFLDISEFVTTQGNEQGLLGLAFHPEYNTNGYFYVNYTDTDGNTVISRFSVSETDPDSAELSSEFSILEINQPFQNHNGGDIRFGPDGYLYIGTGDGGSGGDPGNRAQDSMVLLGKILRIDVDNGIPYSIPGSNPFVADDNALDEIWATGLRNPWRFSFDSELGDLWIGDVGQNIIEEINFQPAASGGGENYGWRCYEGSELYNGEACLLMENYTFPIHEYYHTEDNGCSVTGGFVYRGNRFPSMVGFYFFTDFCNDIIWSLHGMDSSLEVTNHGQFPGNNFSTFGEDSAGELYVTGLSSGAIYRIDYNEVTSTRAGQSPGQWKIYPNPAGEIVWIESVQANEFPVWVSLLATEGKIIRKVLVHESHTQIGLHDLVPGIYFMEVAGASGRETHRLVKF